MRAYNKGHEEPSPRLLDCPAPEELDEAFSPGEPLDPARSAAVADHVGGCSRCRARFRERINVFGRGVRAAQGRETKPGWAGPNRMTILMVSLGVGLLVAGRLGPRPNRHRLEGAAGVSSATGGN
jgi:hypothetical protein